MRPYAADASSTFFNMQMWNSSFRARKRRNSISVQSSMTLQSWSVWIMVTATARSSNPKPRPSITGQRSPLKQHGQRGPRRHQLGRACMKRWRATDRRGWLLLAAIRLHDSLRRHSSPACLSATEDAGAYAAVGKQNRLLSASSCHGNVCAGRVCTFSMKHTRWNRYRFCSRHKHGTFVYLK